MECKSFKGINWNGATMLYLMMPSSEKVSKRAHGLLLEEELQVYNEMKHQLYDGTSSSSEVCNQLAHAYCLRALCTREARPSSQEIIEDIKTAIKIWSSINQAYKVGQFSVIFMYNLIDILSMKNMLATLWQSKRLYHGLCASLVDDSFIKTFSEHYCKEGNDENIDFESMEFWIGSMGTQPLKVGFQLKFSFMCNLFSKASHTDNHAIISDVTIEEVKKVAFDLISQVPMRPPKAFIAACLYNDLAERLIANGRLSKALWYQEKMENMHYAEELVKEFLYLEDSQVLCKLLRKIWALDEIRLNY
ncbi:hypothetical protein OROMI_005161 [Orobanche minor]